MQMIGGVFQEGYSLRVLNSKGVCLWKHDSKTLEPMVNDFKYVMSYADKGFQLEIISNGEKKIAELATSNQQNLHF